MQSCGRRPEATGSGFPWKSATTEFTNPTRYIEVEGIAELDEDGAIAHIHKLSHKYRGTDFPRPEDRLIVRISPSRIHDYLDGPPPDARSKDT